MRHDVMRFGVMRYDVMRFGVMRYDVMHHDVMLHYGVFTVLHYEMYSLYCTMA